MKRFTTFKLENVICNDNQAVVCSIDTSDSIIDQNNKNIQYITDQFGIIRMQTVAHSWFSKEEHAKKVLCQIKKSDYELISFKKQRLKDKLSNKASLPF